jgi:hypothetical protein
VPIPRPRRRYDTMPEPSLASIYKDKGFVPSLILHEIGSVLR